LAIAGWILKTPQSGYWHRPGVSLYFNVNDAYEQELRFPEQIRAVLLKIRPDMDMLRKNVNPDSTNAAIIDRLQDTMRKGVQAGLDGSSTQSCNFGFTGPANGPISRPAIRRAPDPFHGQGLPSFTVTPPPFTVTLPPSKKVTAAAIARPRYKVATNRVYDVVVDNFSGRSIYYYKISHAPPRLSGIQARDKCMWLNHKQKEADIFFAHVTRDTSIQASPNHVDLVKVTIDNVGAEISYLNTLRIALWAKDMDRVKELLSQKTDSQMISSARSARYRLIASGLLKDLGIEIKA
jgi:hypothetical protein